MRVFFNLYYFRKLFTEKDIKKETDLIIKLNIVKFLERKMHDTNIFESFYSLAYMPSYFLLSKIYKSNSKDFIFNP